MGIEGRDIRPIKARTHEGLHVGGDSVGNRSYKFRFSMVRIVYWTEGLGYYDVTTRLIMN